MHSLSCLYLVMLQKTLPTWCWLMHACVCVPCTLRPLGREEPTLFSPEVNVHGGGGDLPFNPVALALQSSFDTKEDVFLGALPSPFTPFTRTPQARRARDKDSFPQSDPAMVPTHCATTPVCSPPGTPSLSPINNTAMRQAATAAGTHPSDECGSTGKTTSTPARVAPGSHTQKTCTAAGECHMPAQTVYKGASFLPNQGSIAK